MIDFSVLTEEEYSLICAAIPQQITIGYFKKNPKGFSTIRPGFRASTITNKEAIKLLTTYRNREFISSFIERITEKWVEEIKETISYYVDNGEKEIAASIHALSQSYFADNASAYFKLVKSEYNTKLIEIISDAIIIFKMMAKDKMQLEESLEDIKSQLDTTKKELSNNRKELSDAKNKIADRTVQLKDFEKIKENYTLLLEKSCSLSESNNHLLSQIHSSNEIISSLNAKIEKIESEKCELEISVRKKIEEEQRNIVEDCFTSPIKPKDIIEFQEYLEYNLESAGVSADIKIILTKYITRIAFQGRPIICNKTTSLGFAKCLANTLIETQEVPILTYSPNITSKEIKMVISKADRIIILDNFIGNYNETELITILERFKSKIIILSVIYERTLYYVSSELLNYCHYINLLHISCFSDLSYISEDPSKMVEEEYMCENVRTNSRFEKILCSIMTELGFSLYESKLHCITNEDDLSQVLLFDILPFYEYVKQKNPLNYSVVLQKYIDRCAYKDIFKAWFCV